MKKGWIYECPKCKRLYPDGQPFCTNVESGCLDYLALIEKPETGGIYTSLIGFKYPFKGYSESGVVGRNATVKRAVIATIRLLFNLFKRHPIKNAIYWLAEIYEADYEKYQVPEKELSISSKEILRVGLKFANRIKDLEYRGRAIKVAWCITMFWEEDLAYRYRGQDIGENIDKSAVEKNVRKEVIRLAKLGIGREKGGLEHKWKVIIWFIKIILILPSVKELTKEVLLELDIDKIKPDIADRYWMCRYFDYDFGGVPYEIRAAWKAEEDKTYIKPEIDPMLYANIDILPNVFFYQLSSEDAEKIAEKVKVKIIELHTKKYVKR